MKSTFSKAVALVLALVMVLSFAACNNESNNDQSDSQGNSSNETAADSYTFKTYSSALATNWNEHTWESNADDTVRTYLTSPFCTMSILDSENGVYQWVWEMATSIEDVTADHQDDLTKYNVLLPEGQTVEETTEGYVFQIDLRPEAKWENGEAITADDYIYSMQQLLNPDMKNYRANLYYSGENALAGAEAYYYSGSTVWLDTVGAYAIADLVAGEDGVYAAADGTQLKIAPSDALEWLGGNSLADYVGAYGDTYFDVESFNALVALADENGYVDVTDESLELLVNVITYSPDWGETDVDACNYLVYAESFGETTFDTVGLYKVNDYTLIYITQAQQDYNYFLTSCTSTWLVYEDLYEAGKDTTGSLVTTNYCTSVDTTMSYGPYKLESVQEAKQMVLVQNPEWYGYEVQEDGSLLSMTEFEVDGEHVQQYQTTKIVIDVMDDAAAKQAFLKGELSEWVPSSDDLLTYSTSDVLYKVDETYTMSFFFNCGLSALQEMDKSKGNTNSVVLSNYNFRKAMSLAIDRAEYVTATSGYKPAYSLMNNLYFYDVYNDPTSSYRNSEPAMQAIVNLYGVEYGEGTPYATLKEAYDSINGYNLTEAKELMAQACQELVEEGLYTEGENIYVRIGWAKGAIDSEATNCVELFNKMINAALEGSGFGTITFEAVGNIDNRYDAVANGEYAIGYGAWGGAAFYPFRNLQVYCDTEQYSVNEIGCWDPSKETLTLNVKGEDVTMTWKDWSNALVGSGRYANEDNELKLEITAQLEEGFLNKYYRIPLAGTTSCSMLAYQCSYYTENYNIMYDFGGMRLLKYNYTDAEWADFVASQGGTIAYE